MGSTIIILISLIAMFIIGLIRLLLRRRRLRKSLAFVVEYQTKFLEFATKEGFDAKIYAWLTLKAPAIQTELGSWGVVSYRPPFERYIVHNYQVFINLLPEIRSQKTKGLLSRLDVETRRESVALCLDVLLRYIGFLESGIEEIVNEFMNPFIWLREGVRFILFLPIFILRWFGLMASHTADRIVSSALARTLAGLVALLGFAGSIIGIIADWDQFITIVTDWWQTLFF